MAIKPVLQALLLADHVYTDQATGKKIVAGVFHQLWFKQFKPPAPGSDMQLPPSPGGYAAGSPFCYLSLTDVHGQQPFLLRYVDLTTDEALFQVEITVGCQDPLATAEVVLALPRLPTQHAGAFALELMWHNEPLGSCRVCVTELKDEPPKEEP